MTGIYPVIDRARYVSLECLMSKVGSAKKMLSERAQAQNIFVLNSLLPEMAMPSPLVVKEGREEEGVDNQLITKMLVPETSMCITRSLCFRKEMKVRTTRQNFL